MVSGKNGICPRALGNRSILGDPRNKNAEHNQSKGIRKVLDLLLHNLLNLSRLV